VIYLDALVVKVRDGAHVRNKAVHIAVGVDMEGIKHVLGIWVQQTEGARFWAGVCAEFANRGVKDVLIVCCDRLTGFPYEKGDPEARFYPNSRNGTTPNTVPAEIGELDLDIPRDRAGTFLPRLVFGAPHGSTEGNQKGC
jgi:transposase-like protein